MQQILQDILGQLGQQEHPVSPMGAVGAVVAQLVPDHPLANNGIDLSLVEDPQMIPWLLGPVYESLLGGAQRHKHGVHYTPPKVARRLAQQTLDGLPAGAVCDPSVGGAAFLLAAAEYLVDQGASAAEVVGERLWGLDLDPAAVQLARLALQVWLVLQECEDDVAAQLEAHVCCADTLEDGLQAFARPPTDGFVAVLGNPPFQGQLTTDTARSASTGAALRQRWDVDAGAYVDTAVLFLVASVDMVQPGGRVTLVQPHSTLVAGGAAAIRQKLLVQAPPQSVWLGGGNIFAASVQVCAPTLQRGAALGTVARSSGPDVVEESALTIGSEPSSSLSAHDLTKTWGPLVSDLLGVPATPQGQVGDPLGSFCTATAGFRDQFYGLADHVEQAVLPPVGDSRSGSPLLITAGMIDPLRNRWGSGSTFRFTGRKWTHPVVNRATLEADNATLGRWVTDRLEPKLLLATQTKVIEAIVDPLGTLVPSTPVVALTPPSERLWHVAAVLMAPWSSAWALHHFGGAALTMDTVKLSATQVLQLPTPANGPAWDRGAHAARLATEAVAEDHWNAALEELATAMGQAYGCSDHLELVQWWHSRRPKWR